MLNDRERAELHELERRLLSDDPRYLHSFDAEVKNLPADDAAEYLRRAYPFLLALSSAAAILFFTVGSPLTAFTFLTVTAVTWTAGRRGHARKESRS